MLYRPDAFRLDDPARILDILRSHPLATLIVVDADRVPSATLVPVVADRSGPGTLRLRFHLARGNPIAEALSARTDVLLSFVGVEGYISPDGYETPHLPPTWNYETIQVRGAVVPVEGDALRTLLADLAALEEARLAPKPPWTDDKMGEARVAGMLRAIRGFELTPHTVEAKAKLSQNRSEADRRAVIRALEAQDTSRPRQLADAMRLADDADQDAGRDTDER